MKAIILAAGFGSRLQPFTKDTPKCLLPINAHESMLARQLRILGNLGIVDITVVAGYKIEKITEKHGKEASILCNARYATTGDAFSLWTARAKLDDDTMLLNGDIVFTDIAISDMLHESNYFSVLIEKKTCELDDVKAEVKNGLIVGLGKGIPLDRAFGEAVGIATIKKEKIDAYRRELSAGIQQNPQIRWLEIFNHLIRKGEEINFTLVKEPCFENDTLEDYSRTRRIFGRLR